MINQGVMASAPGKFILFGEHAVVYGEPALALALNLRITVWIRPSKFNRYTVNGHPLERYRNRYVKKAIELFWNGPSLEIRTKSTIPNAAGLGSSAAITTATVAAIMKLQGKVVEAALAENAFRVEAGVQGKSSPTDTSISTHGNGILVTSDPEDNHLWTLEDGENQWCVNHIDAPEFTMVLGHTRMKANTPTLVSRVRRYVNTNSFAREVVRDIGKLTMKGVEYLKDGNKKKVGELMIRNHNHLAILGINTKELQSMIDAVEPHSYGAKLTGAGGGGCIVALTDEPQQTCEAIKRVGGRPYIVRTSNVGYSIHSSSYENTKT